MPELNQVTGILSVAENIEEEMKAVNKRAQALYPAIMQHLKQKDVWLEWMHIFKLSGSECPKCPIFDGKMIFIK